MDLTYLQRKTLKYIGKRTINKKYVPEDQKDLYSFLLESGYIKFHCIYENDNDRRPKKTLYVVTEKGRLSLERDRKEVLMWIIPVVLSFIAIIISLIAIYASSLPVDVHIHSQIIINITNTIPI